MSMPWVSLDQLMGSYDEHIKIVCTEAIATWSRKEVLVRVFKNLLTALHVSYHARLIVLTTCIWACKHVHFAVR